MVPELGDTSYLSRCIECSSIQELYGATECIFSGSQHVALKCQEGMSLTDEGRCIYE